MNQFSYQVYVYSKRFRSRIYDANTMMQVVSFPKKQYIQMSCDISNDNRYLVKRISIMLIVYYLMYKIHRFRLQQVMDSIIVEVKYQ